MQDNHERGPFAQCWEHSQDIPLLKELMKGKLLADLTDN